MSLQRIRSKQYIFDSTVDAQLNNFINLHDPELPSNAATKAYVDSLFCYLSRKQVNSLANLNITANNTANNGDLAANEAILEQPISSVKVTVNGIEVNIAESAQDYLLYDCYFKSPTGDIRNPGEETVGDKLYWNGSVAGYQLSSTDLIDFEYFIFEEENCPPMTLPVNGDIELHNDGFTYELRVGTTTVTWYKDIDEIVDLFEISPNKYKLVVGNDEVIWSNDINLVDNNGTYTLTVDGTIAVWDANPDFNQVSLINGGNGNYSLTVDGQTVNFNINGMGNPMGSTNSDILLLNDGHGHYSLTVDSTTVNWNAETDPQVHIGEPSPGVYTLTVRNQTIQWTDLLSQQVLLNDNGDYTATLTVDNQTVNVLLEGYTTPGGGSGGGSNVTAVNNPNGTTTLTVNGTPYTLIRVEQDPTFTIVDNGTSGTITSDGLNYNYIEQETDPTIQFINNNNGTATLVKGATAIGVLTSASSGGANPTTIVNNNNGTYTISNGNTTATLLSAYTESDPNVSFTDNGNGTVTATKNSINYILAKPTYTTVTDNNNNTITLTVGGVANILSKNTYTSLVNNNNGTGTVTVGTTSVNFSTTPTQLINNPNGTATLQVGNTTSTLITQEQDPNVSLVDNNNNTANLTVHGLTKTILLTGSVPTVILTNNNDSTYTLQVGSTSALINKGNIDGTGTTNFIPVFTDQDTIANSLISQSSTEIIGHAHFTPSTSELYNIGSNTEFWQNIYMNNAIIFNDNFYVQKSTGSSFILHIDTNDKMYLNIQGNQNAGSLLLSNGNGEAIWTTAQDFFDMNPAVQTTVSSYNDKNWSSLVTTGNGALASNSTITDIPFDNSYVEVKVNGVEYLVGNADKTKDCYFSSDNGVTAKSFSSSHANGKISVGDKLYWNGNVVGFDLTLNSRIAIFYLTNY